MTAAPGPSRVRAWVRPVVTVYAYRAAAGLVLGYPAARTFTAFAPASPEGDAVLFAPGGLQLMEALRLGGRAIGGAAEGATAAGLILALGGLFPLAAALSMLAEPLAPRREAAARAAGAWPSLVLIAGATVLAQAAVMLGVATSHTALASALLPLADERTADLLAGGVGLVGLGVVLALGIAQDVARAAIVRVGLAPGAALLLGLRSLVTRPLAVARGWLPPVLLGGILVAATASVVGAIDVSSPGALRVAAVLVLHQSTALVLSVLRISWLSGAVALAASEALEAAAAPAA